VHVSLLDAALKDALSMLTLSSFINSFRDESVELVDSKLHVEYWVVD